MVAASVSRSMLTTEDSCCEVIFRFSDQPSKSPTPSPPKRSPIDLLLETLYEDTNSQDVHFVFDDLSMSNNKATQGANTAGPLLSGTIKVPNLSDLPGTRNGGKGTVLGGHKLVLRQWPYFRTMFESEFAEGGDGDKMIRIKDTSPKAFQMLLRFMYTCKLPDDDKPTKVYVDVFNKHTDISWETLYLAAHRYDIQELCQIARDSILANLNLTGTVPFLFRSAYLFEDLREPVIKYVAASCGSIIASKSAREMYMDHPEGARIFGELFEHIYARK